MVFTLVEFKMRYAIVRSGLGDVGIADLNPLQFLGDVGIADLGYCRL